MNWNVSTEELMAEALPTGLVCTKCGKVFGALLNITRLETRGSELKAICQPCVNTLSKEKGIKLDSPENWAKLLEN